MTEKYLQFIWRNKRLKTFEFTTKENVSIRIIDFGLFNAFNAGPDFQHGCIEIDQVKLYGHIEIHVKSSDWVKHKHHLDKNYDNVILHVVHENDYDVVQNGLRIPTIELKKMIDYKHYAQFLKKQLRRATFPCEMGIKNLDVFHLNRMKISALTQKFQEKNKLLQQFGLKNDKEIIYNLFGMAFSMSVNKNAFLHLMQKVSYSSIEDLSPQKKKSLILTESGLLQRKKSGKQELWNFKGTRPPSFPMVRVNQFANLVAHFSFELTFCDQSPIELLATFKSLINKIDFSASNGKRNLSKKMIDLLIINALCPFLWYLGEKKEDERFMDKAIQVLELLPPENNTIIARWKKIEIHPKNAFDSQSLLALYRYFCNQKKCLSCDVGEKLLNIN